ncbi:thioredoxin-disulfide reductase [Myxococcus sp. CA051A]|uniref:Thioredoxin reductase n=1 Tax=Myxococcus llanfairpwllgwyngyllgogerychwyrndrobwllllantysiliogogogochensis TaxID=2590453 RepID=A0A540WIZ9_9BACT|nr:thioredoxin-disulfide reductase [Myxococcus llanfairpwllgwyngyllgogerychwyrndrobwllllantysiliogogogochensis]NTX07174.1 thioredoxin-disulfide reductase [Myxococcus sp. CA040A]NTX17508.1 thioredoxin-disulfide reductase [Myxococcus sp. CA056]NTX39088.1 thioredoxin-disulfide reductase [Myxococcus sp. CA033]NTX58122.1 thioredoxin-disulfide reductase [Myxococcus sp. CA039A]NTX66498.1 thioredoxin-disulfide reductase [Myxococcus sp. CA051A]
MAEEKINKVTIIGSGPAGYTAAIYAARANLEPMVFAGGPTLEHPQRVPGGQLMVTTDVENYPGFPEAITGPELMDRFQKQAERFGTVIHMENVVKVDFSKRPFVIEGESGIRVLSETVIISTGATAKWLSVKGEDIYKNRGVSACATCDGAFFKNQEVLVVGGGDTAMEEATYLAKIVKHVTLVHRRDSLRASKVMQERALNNPKISFLWNSAVEEVTGNAKGMTGAVVRNLKTGDSQLLNATGLFVAIGHTPNTELFQGILETHQGGYLKTVAGSTRTNIPGVFACGDVQDSYYRQAITAAGTGCMAAIDAERWLIEQGE